MSGGVRGDARKRTSASVAAVEAEALDAANARAARWKARYDEASATLARVRSLHAETYRSVAYVGGEATYSTRCSGCGEVVPCKTAAALGGAR